MYLKITKKSYKGKILQHAKIVESYRDGKTSRQKIILNLGSIRSNEDLKGYQNILQDMKKEEEFIKIKHISAKNSKQFGITYTVDMLLKKYEIDDILKSILSNNDAKFDVYGVINALIINRLECPSSELAACEWIQEDYCKELNVQEHHLYRALDYLIPKKEVIEKEIFNSLKKKLKLNTDFVFCDLTSTYFEGQCCTIALYGYSRDHRKDRRQIVVAVVMCDGIPIYHEVFKGNTADKKTLDGIIKHLKSKFNIIEVIFVADRGLMTEENITKLELEDYDYILGSHRRNFKISEELLVRNINTKDKQAAREVCEKDVMINESFLFSVNTKSHQKDISLGIISQELRDLFRENNHPLSNNVTLKVKHELKNTKRKNQWRLNDKENNYTYSLEKKKNKINIYKERSITKRYILCLDKDTKKMRLEELKSIKKNVENKLKELAERYKKSQTSKKGKKMTKESLIVQTYKILGRNKRLFNPDFENGLTYPINKNKWEYERKIAGKFLLVTDVDIEPNYAMKQYKQLQMVENAFDELKNFLSVRGIYHYKPRRVRAHVCISFFGLLMECIIEKFCSQTARVIIRKLGRIEVIKLDLKGKEKKILTKMTKETETIFDQLNIPKPLGLNY